MRRIPGNICSAEDEMSYIPSKVCQNCYQIACRTVYPAFVVQARHPDIQRESDSPYFAWAVTSSTMHFYTMHF